MNPNADCWTRLLRAVPVLCSVAVGMGCSSCRKESRREPGQAVPPGASFEVAPGRLQAPWSWTPTDAREVAVPAGCKLTGPPHRHLRDTRNLFFLASAGDPGTLAVASGDPSPGHVTDFRGLVGLGTDAPGSVRDVPWLHLLDPPIMASSAKGWIALLSEHDGLGPSNRVWLWREGGHLDLLAEGDRLAPVDARCDASGCVVLTTHAGQVATRGATAWVGDPGAPISGWTRVEIPAEHVEEGAVALGVAQWDVASRSVLVVFEDPEHVAFVRATAATVKGEGKIDRGHVVLDFLAMRDGPMVVMTRGEPDANGCVAAGAQVEIAMPGRPPHTLPTPVPPSSGYVRVLNKGAFMTWAAPMHCRVPERKVVYGVLLRADGAPASSTMALGNADGHAVTTRGDEVHVWLSDSQGVTWIRAKCEP